jgi:hypothetical protein
MVGRCCCLRLASLTFIMRVGFSTSTLAYMLDSLVRVSRRVGKNHFGKIARSTLRPHAHRRTPNYPTNRARFGEPLRVCDLILPHDGEQDSRFPMCQPQPVEVLAAGNG